MTHKQFHYRFKTRQVQGELQEVVVLVLAVRVVAVRVVVLVLAVQVAAIEEK